MDEQGRGTLRTTIGVKWTRKTSQLGIRDEFRSQWQVYVEGKKHEKWYWQKWRHCNEILFYLEYEESIMWKKEAKIR